MDGFSNDDHPSESKPGAGDLVLQGKPVDMQRFRARWDLDYVGGPMPPPAVVKSGKVKPLTDEDRRTLVRWIDLGCPIDLDFEQSNPSRNGRGWMLDDNRPVLTLTYPRPRQAAPIDRILLGMHDYYSGLDTSSLRVVAGFDIDGVAAGNNLASRFQPRQSGVWEFELKRPMTPPPGSKLVVSVQDRQGNITKIERTLATEPGTRAK